MIVDNFERSGPSHSWAIARPLHPYLKYVPMRSLFALLLCASAGLVQAQLPLVDITVAPGQNNDLVVKVRPDLGFDGFFAGSVFTIRWDASTDAHLGSVQNFAPMNQAHIVSKSGGEVDDNGFRYQVFAGFGTSTLSDIPWAWVADEEIVLCHVLVNGGPTEFSIAADNWASENNGEFYVSLNGSDETGIIYETPTAVVQNGAVREAFTVLPNPTLDATTIHVEGATGTTFDLELLNAAGQLVWSEHAVNASGTYRRTLDMSGYDHGVYMLRCITGESTRTLRIVRK